MGLTSALTTALTGLAGAETQIDVIGNNLANSQTTGFKQSRPVFATQFYQTQSIGGMPTADNGGTNPRQIGLGVQVAEITPEFSQGTVEVSSSPSDLAIQGDGFFIVQSAQGEQLYTRNGIFKLNADSELVSSTGQRVLGYGVDDTYTIQSSQLTPLSIPLGASAVARATTVATFEGNLTPTGDLGDTAQVIETLTLGDGSAPAPDATGVTAAQAPTPSTTSGPTTATGASVAGGALTPGAQYEYRFAFADPTGTESAASDILAGQVGAAENALNLNNLPSPPGGEYSLVNVYRREAGADAATPACQFRLVGQDLPTSGAFLDDGSADIAAAPELDDSTLTGSYAYMITYAQGGANETRPVALPDGAVNVVNGRIQIQNLPTPPAGYDQVRLYRNLQNSPDSFYLIETLQPGDSYTDSKTDAEISNLTLAGNQTLDMNGPRIGLDTLLTDVTRHDGDVYQQVFQTGTLQFAGRKGDRSLAAQTLEITDTTTVADLLDFMQGALGVQPTNPADANPIPTSENQIAGETGDLAAGVYLNDGRIRVVSNNGVDNSIDITSSGMQIVRPDGQTVSPNLSYNTLQEAEGQSTVADFVAYDSLGVPINVRVTAVLESRDGNATTYRWYADSPQNDLASGIDIGLGTGLVQFDGDGNLLSTSNPTLMIARQNIPSTTPLEFELDFSSVSGLASPTASLSASRQDGFPPGTLESFDIGEDGIIRGIFSNGATRDLGQIQIARFANPQGLEQLGQTMFGAGVNSGLPVVRAPGQGGAGAILAGAVELSNTDIGENLTDLILAATQYRGNTRVITTSQQLLDELLNIRR